MWILFSFVLLLYNHNWKKKVSVFSCCNLKSLTTPPPQPLVSEPWILLVTQKAPEKWMLCGVFSALCSLLLSVCLAMIFLWLLIVFILICNCCLDAKSIFFLLAMYLPLIRFLGNDSVLSWIPIYWNGLLLLLFFQDVCNLTQVWEIFNLEFFWYKSRYKAKYIWLFC